MDIEENKKPPLDPFRFYINNKRKHLFVAIRKCAATTITRFFRINGECIQIWKEDYIEKYKDYYSFRVIRNPIDRFISGFISNILAKPYKDWYKYYMDKKVKVVLNKKGNWGGYDIEVSPENITLAKEIVKDLILKMNTLGEACNAHVLPQLLHIPPSCSIDFHLLFDYLEEDSKRLAKKLGWKNTKVRHTHKNQNPKITKEVREYVINNKELYSILLSYYKEDFELYNKVKRERIL